MFICERGPSGSWTAYLPEDYAINRAKLALIARGYTVIEPEIVVVREQIQAYYE